MFSRKFQIRVAVQKGLKDGFHLIRLTEKSPQQPCWCLKSLYTQENVKSVFIPAAHSSYVHFTSVDMLFYSVCTWTVCFSLSSLLYHHHPCGWLSPAKPWWSIETFGMLTPPEGTQNGEWHWSQCDDLLEVLAFIHLCYVCLFFLCVLFDNQSFFFAVHILSIWISPCIGLSSLDISMLCLSSPPQTVLSDAQDAQWNLLFLWLFGKECQIKETSGLSALTCITSLPVRVPVVSHARVLCSVDRMILFVLFLTIPSTDIQMRVDFLLLPTGCRLCFALLKLFIYPHREWWHLNPLPV